jgi:hypothetical protein
MRHQRPALLTAAIAICVVNSFSSTGQRSSAVTGFDLHRHASLGQ